MNLILTSILRLKCNTFLAQKQHEYAITHNLNDKIILKKKGMSM